jgi:membrane protease subunit HflK
MSFNDPQWGKRDDEPKRPNDPQDGPPDLDAIWQNLNKRLNEMFGDRRGGGNRNEPPSRQTRHIPRIPGNGILWLIVILVLLWCASGFYTVDAGNRGVVTRFGKYTQTTNPGLNWHLPYPIESAEVIPFSQVQFITIGYRGDISNRIDREATMLTDDENIIDILFAVQYNVKNAYDYVFNNRDTNTIVSFVAETAIREVVGKNTMDDALYVNRQQIASDTQTLMQKMLDAYKTGVQVQQVTLQSIQPPDRVQAAFADAVKAGQDADRMRNEGEAYANKVVPEAKGVAARLLAEANGYQAAVVQRATGDASRFTQLYAQYKKAPEVTRNRLYIDAMQQVFQNTTKVIVDEKGGNNLLYLPLDKLIEQTRSAQGATPAAANGISNAPTVSTQPQPSSPAPSRADQLRSRNGM